MKLSLLTPTRERPRAFNLLRRWVERMDLPRQADGSPDWQWIVASDGSFEDYDVGRGMTLLRVPPWTEGLGVGRSRGGLSLCANVHNGLSYCTGDVVVILEDDDWYHRDYARVLLEAFEVDPLVEMVGMAPAHYYHLPSRRWQSMGNAAHASLAQTAFRGALIPHVQNIAAMGASSIDLTLWGVRGPVKRRRLLPATDGGRLLHLGLKGLPGTAGIGAGHRAKLQTPDPEYAWLGRQLGADAEAYAELVGGAA